MGIYPGDAVRIWGIAPNSDHLAGIRNLSMPASALSQSRMELPAQYRAIDRAFPLPQAP
jgi:hypothetical protein